MRRRNIKQAFVGEGDPGQEGLNVEGEGQEDVEFNIKNGHIAFVVPAGTPDAAVFDKHVFVHAELVLENGAHVTIGLQADTVGGRVSVSGPNIGSEAGHDLSEASIDTQGDAV
ncbi:MAG: hypothetical protein ACR2JY_23725 [Chloroflexota bacterium]